MWALFLVTDLLELCYALNRCNSDTVCLYMCFVITSIECLCGCGLVIVGLVVGGLFDLLELDFVVFVWFVLCVMRFCLPICSLTCVLGLLLRDTVCYVYSCGYGCLGGIVVDLFICV